ncbi:nucleotide-binding universal stress UspA family protein [Tenacibaculum adriaticum]|uniref:Nucleotide-binding universal stress UspA family protein n=1 Tax=Tenacibaculum adriaticum TaxID=413713 RepID=A0A5S5DXU2_9FLAO|nr:universal stress protein [Tenacibaculum adriaticum]TYQ00079.1 nucleotide-binding universal stress UspA family protein [Tenacibaculum adriaticum]
MKRVILHATDYSENAIPALKYAFSLSEKLNASLFIVHIFDYPTIFDEGLKEPYNSLEKESYKLHHDKLVDFCKKHYKGDLDKIDVTFEAIEDKSIENGIITKINELNADLIVTGTKSEKLLKELLLGRTIKHLIDRAPCPVLMVPKKAKVREIRTIVYASDFEERDINAIQDLLKIAKPYNATLKIVHFSTKEEYHGDEQMEWFKELLREKISYNNIETEILFSDNIFNSLREYLGKNKADIVAMLERTPKGLVKKIFHADLVKKMGTLGNFPLMSFNENRL